MADIQIMTPLHVSEVCAIEEATFATPWSRQSIEREVTGNPCARYLVITEGAHVLGYAGMWLILDEAHITNVAIRQDKRGAGLGEKLMRALVQLAADSGMNWMTLEVRASNLPAQNLWASSTLAGAKIITRITVRTPFSWRWSICRRAILKTTPSLCLRRI